MNYALLYPRSNSATGGTANTAAFVSAPTQTRNSDTADGRVDWQIDQKDLIFGRFTYNNVPFTLPGLLPSVTQNGVTVSPGGNVYAFQGTAKDTAQNSQINFVRTISPTVLLQLGFGYTRVNNQSIPLNYGVNASQALGLPGVNLGDQVTSGLTPVFVGSLASLGSGNFIPIIDIDNTFQETGSVTLTRGKHSIKAGAALIRRQATNIQNNFGIGSYTFNPLPHATTQEQLSGLTALLQGNFNNVERSNSLVPPHYRNWEPSVYLQDDYRAASNLTLNLGVRYEILTPFTEVKNALTNFDPTSGKLLVANQNGVNKYGGLDPTWRLVSASPTRLNPALFSAVASACPTSRATTLRTVRKRPSPSSPTTGRPILPLARRRLSSRRVCPCRRLPARPILQATSMTSSTRASASPIWSSST